VWLVSLIFPIIALVQARLSPVDLALPAAGLVGFVTFYLWSMQPHPIADRRRMSPTFQLSAILMVTILILVLSAAYGIMFLWLLVGASAVAGKTLPTRAAHVATALLPLLSLGAGVALSGGLAARIGCMCCLSAAGPRPRTGYARAVSPVWDHSSSAYGARRAGSPGRRGERLRLARDLHDLLGHTLSLIVLKSELAGRLLEKAPVQAKTEIQDLESVARQALREVREAVAGYRQPTLESEFDGARQMLEAAGITCTIHNAAGILPSDIDATLAWAVREGVTNIIRHSRAHQCTINIATDHEAVCAEVLNDGYRGDNSKAMHPGSGLSGVAERVKAHGGSIEARPSLVESVPSFRLFVELPIQRTETQQEQAS
jgi:two-component system sensor histidine kinase DesK